MNKRVTASVLIGVLSGTLLGMNVEKFYLNGMFVDNDLLETLTPAQYQSLTKNNVFETSAIYFEDNLSMKASIWSKDLTAIGGSSLSISRGNEDKATLHSGMMFHTINEKLYAYSSGDIRDNPDKFKLLITELIGQVEELAVDMN